MTALSHYSAEGSYSFTTMDEFYFWLGKDENEFLRLMAYPKAPILFSRKKEALRRTRREEKENE